MKFILDANIPYSAKRVFQKADRVFHVGEIGLGDASDEEILRRAFREGAILVTRDLDFANVILHPSGTHSGIIVIRVPPHFTANSIKKVLKLFFTSLPRAIRQSLTTAITIVEPGQYRIRR